MAHKLIQLAERLSVHPVGWKPDGFKEDGDESAGYNAPGRLVAWCQLDFRDLGSLSRNLALDRPFCPTLPGRVGQNGRSKARFRDKLPKSRKSNWHHATSRPGAL